MLQAGVNRYTEAEANYAKSIEIKRNPDAYLEVLASILPSLKAIGAFSVPANLRPRYST